jgi:hypothetical protein
MRRSRGGGPGIKVSHQPPANSLELAGVQASPKPVGKHKSARRVRQRSARVRPTAKPPGREHAPGLWAASHPGRRARSETFGFFALRPWDAGRRTRTPSGHQSAVIAAGTRCPSHDAALERTRGDFGYCPRAPGAGFVAGLPLDLAIGLLALRGIRDPGPGDRRATRAPLWRGVWGLSGGHPRFHSHQARFQLHRVPPAAAASHPFFATAVR